MILRDAREADLAAIVHIYNASIPSRLATADLEPIPWETRWGWFRDHSSTSYPLWVAQVGGSIAGWLSFQEFYGRPAYRKTAELSIYVSPERRRQGIGRALLQRAGERSPQLGFNRLLGFIFAHNQPSLNLFAQHQFQTWGCLPGVAELDGIERDLLILGRQLPSLLDDEDGAGSMVEDVVTDAAQQEFGQSRPPAAAHDNQVSTPIFGS